MIFIAQGNSSNNNGHPGVAAWVGANSSGVLAYWPCNDAAASATMQDQSGNGRNGTWGSTATTGTIDGQTVSAHDGDAGDRATAADIAAWDSISGAFCVVTNAAVTGLRSVLDRDLEGVGSPDRSWQFRINATTLQFLRVPAGGGGATTISSGSGAIANVNQRYTLGWHLRSGTLYLYIDGVEVTSGAVSALSTGASPVAIGFHQATSSATEARFSGNIGSVVLVNSSAPSTAMAQLHDAWLLGYP